MNEMKGKIIAVLAALMMVATGAVLVVSADESSAADGDIMVESVVLTKDGTVYKGEFTRIVNENEYSKYYADVKWYVASSEITKSNVDSADWVALSDGVSQSIVVDSSSIEVIETKQDSVGSYKFEVSSNSAINSAVTFALKCEISVKVSDPISGEAGTKVFDVYYNVNVVTSEDGTISMTLASVTMTYGVPYSESVIPAGISEVSMYVWYAEGLPNGLAMQNDGTITGIPIEAGEFTVKVTATGKEDTHSVVTGTLSLTVEGKEITPPTSVMYTVKVGDGNFDSNPTLVIATQNESVVMNFYSGITEQNINGTLTDATTVKVIKDGAEISVTSTSTGVYDIPTDGTGSYLVKINYSGSTSPLLFSLVVISDFEDITAAGILVSGN